MLTTILTLRAPGMTMFRMPVFTWNIMITALLVFPILAAALLRCSPTALEAGRLPGRPATGVSPDGWTHAQRDRS